MDRQSSLLATGCMLCSCSVKTDRLSSSVRGSVGFEKLLRFDVSAMEAMPEQFKDGGIILRRAGAVKL